MKVKANGVNLDANKGFPPELFHARKIVVSALAPLFSLGGIGHITQNYTVVGITGVADLSFVPMVGEPPPAILKIRTQAVRLLADYLRLFGVLDMEVIPDATDIAGIQEMWRQLLTGEPALAGATQSMQEVPLQEPDPSGESVLPKEGPRGPEERTETVPG